MLFCIGLPNFVQIRATTAEIWRYIDSTRWWPGRSILLPVSNLLLLLPSEGQSLSANQISSKYLNSRLRYNYFRFGKTNVPYWNFTSGLDIDHFAVIGVLFCISMPNFVQIGPWIAEIWRHIDFQDGGHQPCCICFVVMAGHLWSVFRGLNLVLKSLFRRINSSGDIAMCRLWGVLAWYLFTPLFGIL